MLLHSGFWLRKNKPQKILASWAFPDAVASNWLSKILKCDFYFKVHGSDIDIQCQNKALAKQVVAMSKNAKGILSVSQALADKMIKLGIEKDKIRVIYNGVNHEKFSQKTPCPFTSDYLLFIGNLKHDKGVMELLEGFAQIADKHPELHLIYIGNGQMMSLLQEQAKKLNISHKVKFLGNINHDDVPQWLSHAKALALPSYHEGVPNVLLEAMSCGRPVIATSVGGIPEIIDEKHCGVLILKQSKEAVADAISMVVSRIWDYQLIKTHSLQFSWQKNKKQLIDLIENK
jgi:glycosyltransferase involved in cell wall biosynthesis